MARFSVGGDEDETGAPSNGQRQRLSKKPRTLSYTSTSTSTSNLVEERAPLGEEYREKNKEKLKKPSEFGEGSGEGGQVAAVTEEEYEDEEEEAQRIHEVQPAEAGVDRNPSPIGIGAGGEVVSITLTDPDVLACPICFEPLSIPVYQCENGHIACSLCCNKMRNTCGSCCSPIGYNRCRAIEKVLESIKISCRNMQYGCIETLHYGMKFCHEKTCQYAPCSCPHPGCDYVGMSNCLYKHFATQHSNSSRKFFLNMPMYITLRGDENHVFYQEMEESTLFILNRSIEPCGSFVNVICIAPTSLNRYFVYELTAKDRDCSINLKASTEFVPKWNAQPPAKNFLVIPSDFSVHRELRLKLIIRSLI